ncbi:MAG TPA: hypothetical protein VG325_19595 [Solirubrobacteraceae bacterium]|nr:hypothetical protein [Solirubrobacteraceae bacterium]
MMRALMDAVLDLYDAHISPDVSLLQPTLGEAGRLLERRAEWRAVLSSG